MLKHATNLEDLLSFDEMTSMSGLDFMTGTLEGRLPSPPIGKVMNYHLDAVEKGMVRFRGTPEFEHCNPLGTVHGGWYGTLLDSCMACAVMTAVPKGSFYTTLEYKINIVRSIPLGTEIVAEATLQHSGRSTGVAVGELRDAETGRLYATGSTTCIIMGKPG
ncbi:MAG: PaaI family thioesterase [Pelagimonas sp.]|jgi:uncharacterized protein (TIGR00369 family)|nr:PaaI family thioesterase [Pelagimonas sp.]